MKNLLSKLIFKNDYDKKSMFESVNSSLNTYRTKDIDGNIGVLEDYLKDKKAIVFVNVACSCGLTSEHYNQLVDLYSKYKDKGLQILAFPCNQFKNQESKIESEIKEYVRSNFNATFPIFSKIEVNGPNTDPIYVYLKTNTKEFNKEDKELKNIPWNFAKFLVNKEGKVIQYYSPNENPKEMISQIENML